MQRKADFLTVRECKISRQGSFVGSVTLTVPLNIWMAKKKKILCQNHKHDFEEDTQQLTIYFNYIILSSLEVPY